MILEIRLVKDTFIAKNKREESNITEDIAKVVGGDI
jgi:hypothetical protein